ncbi:RHS repeat-associated core domain-containing protein [Massilia sp. CFBP9026]|uniref:RHS repeat-associated core domain-containing protein n=1 Tax=Massilia sp. CFBP9026 TaxID=3096536 RepID=UPI002A6B06EA|nr:RHS repeat-associated core domain-containing protein [Massilia sp. CFBP9026]MDY0964327.1 RHS repeat-associated core domain-containing protein [Massilia sp. CFBP9026]
MTETKQPPPKPTERAPEVAVAPLNTIDQQDVGAGAAAFDKWLRKISNDYVTLERLSTVAGSLPVIGNIMALVDAIMDMVGVIQKTVNKKEVDFLHWVSLGINLIGVVPVPPAMGAARMSLRPALHLVRQKLALGVKDLGSALIEVLIVHLNARLAGEIETFVDSAMGKLAGILDDCADTADGISNDLIKILNRCIGKEPLFEVASPAEVESKLHDPKVESSLRRMLGALGRQYKNTANYVAAAAASHLPQSAVAGVTGIIGHLTDFKPAFRGKLAALADEQAQMSIRWLLVRLRDAVVKHKRRHPAMVPSAKGADHKKNNPGHELGASGRQSPAKGDANACKLCPAKGGTAHSISFATGAETFTHTDFVLDAPLPIGWNRTYRSQLSAYDRGSLGARWLTPYTTRIDVVGQGKPTALLYHAADGRSHRYPWLGIGQRHYDPVEQITLTRVSAALLTLDFGMPLPEGEPSPWRETYELVDTVRAKAADFGKEHFRLIALHSRDGAALGLRYDHVVANGPYAGEEVLSDIVSKQGETIVAHVGTQIDPDSCHIRALWEIKDGKLLRQLAAYDYDDHGDLLQAQDENGAAWHYQYDRHLVTRYTDRTGRGMNLAYDTSIDSGLHAKAIREWADDGIDDTRLEWDKNIRLTYVTDALGQETRYYYDIAGYTYRTVYPDGLEEWLFRDDAKNVVRHIHTDGSSEHYRYDDHGNLLTHTRADGSQVHFEYDGQHHVTGIRDAEGGTWKRDYDAQGHLVEEIDPRGNKTQYAYDKAGQPVEVTDAKGGVTKLIYSPDGQLAGYTDCSGHSRQWEYDNRKRLVKSIDAAGNATRYRYTPLGAETLAQARGEGSGSGNHPGQLEAVIHPDGAEEQFRHDAEGRLLAHIDAMQRTVSYRYTAAGLIAKRTDALGHSLQYRWDALGRLSALENENDSVYRFQYDPVGRLLREQGFDGKATEYRYDEASGVLAETGEAGVTTQLEFDPMGRLVQRRAAAPGKLEQIETFAYNANGQLAEAKNEHARLQWFYDDAGNLVREHQHYQGPFHADKRTAVWHHHHDELNQRIGTTRPDGHRIEWLTYGAGHVHGLLLDGQELVTFERDALYQETSRNQANGLQQKMKYDPVGRLIEQQLGAIALVGRKDRHFSPDQYRPDVQVGMQAAIVRRYGYDQSGQLTSLEDNRRGRIEYRYDAVGRLLAANSALGRETFAFDPAGNIQAPNTAQHEPIRRRVPLPKLLDNLLKEYAGVRYRYDERGNVVERTQDGLRSEYEWDAFNRMTRATTWHGVTSFAYDPLGRRIAKHSGVMKGTAFRETARTMYGWDGDTLALESSVHQGYAADERTVHYVYERDSFVPLMQATRNRALRLAPMTDVKALMTGNDGKYDIALDPLWNGEFEQEAEPFGKDEIAFYQCDHLGTPQELTDCEGTVAWSAQYKAWGQAKEAISEAASKAGIRNPIRFQGQYFDDETELHYNRHRYYDPLSGRFVSKDPIGLLGGFNTHTYAPNPVQWIDPLGLAPKKQNALKNGCATCDPCQGRNPSAVAQSWQGRDPYNGVDSYKNVVVRKGTVLYTLYPHGDAPGNYLVKSEAVVGARSARQYNDSVQVAHKGNWKSRDARPMRTKVHGYVLTKDTCMAVGVAKNNPNLGKGGAKQYFIENKDKPNLVDTGRIIAYGN